MKIATPIMSRIYDDKEYNVLIKELRQMQTTEVFAAIRKEDYADVESATAVLKELAEKLQNDGLKVSVWIDGLSSFKNESHQVMVDINGNTDSPLACPLNDKYADEFCEFLSRFANIGIKSFVIDDNYRMQLCSVKTACFCPKHMELYREILGENVTREKMKEMIIGKAPNKYRAAWILGCREALEHTAVKIRQRLDSIDPSINITLCVGPALFGADGTDPYSMAEILAGKNEKRLRLIGAPYWERMFGDTMLSAIDFARHQAFECKKRGITTFGEGDPWPRPRLACSATKLEFFHTITLADGNFDYILKYGIEYTAKPSYECGYAKIAETNKRIYSDAAEMFSNKTCVGFNFVESLDKGRIFHKLTENPEMDVIVSKARNFPVYMSLPICFDSGGVNLIFGENARVIKREILKNGSVLDIKSAKILSEAGIDVGISSFEEADNAVTEATGFQHLTDICHEYYVNENDICELGAQPHCEFGLKVCADAEILSEINVNGKKTIGSYIYTNKNSESFLVYNFDVDKDVRTTGMVRSYYRQNQIFNCYEKLNGNKLHAYCPGNPDLYIMTKKGENSLAIGLWNYFEDELLNPMVILGEKYTSVKFVNCDGVLKDDRIEIKSKIRGYDFAFIEVRNSEQ